MPLRQTALLALALVAASAAQTTPPTALEFAPIAGHAVFEAPEPTATTPPVAKPAAHPHRARFNRRVKTIATVALGVLIVVSVAVLQAAAENPTIK